MTSCPKCRSENIYQDGLLWTCPECFHEWTDGAGQNSKDERVQIEDAEAADAAVRDANGVLLQQGDSVIVLKDLKIKGSSGSVKSGTKVKNIRLYDAGDGHNISCKIDGIGAVNLKSEFVRKS